MKDLSTSSESRQVENMIKKAKRLRRLKAAALLKSRSYYEKLRKLR